LKAQKKKLGVKNISWQKIRDVLTCYKVHGKKYPDSIDDNFLHNVTIMASTMWGNWFRNDEMCRLAAGRFFKEIIACMPTEMIHRNDIEDKTKDDKTKKKFFIFSGHDSTIVPILCSLGIYKDVWPPYASNVVFEIATDKFNPKKIYIRTIYNDRIEKLPFINNNYNETKEKFQENSITAWYPLEHFIDNWRHLLPTNFEKECEKHEKNKEAVVELIGTIFSSQSSSLLSSTSTDTL